MKKTLTLKPFSFISNYQRVKVIFLFTFISSSIFSQLNLGIGVGQQYGGTPGFRVGCYFKGLEPSVNFGKDFFNKNYFLFGAGLSLYYRRNSSVGLNINKKLSYNIDFVNHSFYGVYKAHSLLANLEFYIRRTSPIQIRLGIGAAYTKYIFIKPYGSIGIFVDLGDLKTKGFHFHFKRKIGKE